MRVRKRVRGWGNKEKGLIFTATAVILEKEVPHNLQSQTPNRIFSVSPVLPIYFWDVFVFDYLFR